MLSASQKRFHLTHEEGRLKRRGMCLQQSTLTTNKDGLLKAAGAGVLKVTYREAGDAGVLKSWQCPNRQGTRHGVVRLVKVGHVGLFAQLL